MLSVIIPACNEENYLKETIESIRQQNIKDYEIIVVSDGSTDKTDEIASKHADKFLRLEKRLGPAYAKNAGARLAKGKILVFLDADTKLTKDVLKEIKETTKENVVGTCKIEPSNKALKHRVIMSLKNTLLCPFGVSNGIVFCTKNTFEKYGTYPQLKKREEGVLIRTIKREGEFVMLDKPVINSMRRFEKLGYTTVFAYWIKEALKPSDEDYPVVR